MCVCVHFDSLYGGKPVYTRLHGADAEPTQPDRLGPLDGGLRRQRHFTNGARNEVHGGEAPSITNTREDRVRMDRHRHRREERTGHAVGDVPGGGRRWEKVYDGMNERREGIKDERNIIL